MFLTVLAFNVVGDTLRALTDPRPGASVMAAPLAFDRGRVGRACRRRAARCARSTTSISPGAAGRTLGVVGESGCGKTMLSRAILQLLPKRAKLSGRVMLDGRDLAGLPAPRRCAGCAGPSSRWCSRIR